MEYTEQEQKWLADRKGRISGSVLGAKSINYTPPTDDKPSTWKLRTPTLVSKYLWGLVAQWFTDGHVITMEEETRRSGTKQMMHGIENEPEAIAEYESRLNCTVVRGTEFVYHNNFVGGTPDGFVGDDGIIEVKCPYDTGVHMQTLAEGTINPNYHVQMQFYLWLTDRKWCDFISYTPYMFPACQLYVQRIYRDEPFIEFIAEHVAELKQKLLSYIHTFNQILPEGYRPQFDFEDELPAVIN